MTVTPETHTPSFEDIPQESAPAAAVPPVPAEVDKPDIEVILATPTDLQVEGIPAQVKRLKSREFFALLRVLTNGLGSSIHLFKLDTKNPSALQAEIVAMAVMAIPNAFDDFVDFVQHIVDAKDPKRTPDLKALLENPEIDVIIDVITVLAEQEKDDIVALGGKAKAALSKIQSVYAPIGN